MKRLSIFVFYDFEGKVDSYVEFLIHSLQAISDKIVVVVNGEITDQGKKKILKISPYMFQRENRGFDAGAYKDVFLKYFKQEELKDYDEIILQNDTFYGPLYGWNAVFSEMEKQDVDFWGLSRHADSHSMMGGKAISDHIQGYFMVCRKKLFTSKEFLSFWKEMKYPENIVEAISKFEIHFSTTFKRKGFRYTSYLDMKNPDYLRNNTSNPYFQSYILLKEMGFPVVKRKALTVYYYSQAHQALEFIEKNTNYDIHMIYEHQKRLSDARKINPYGYSELKSFIESHRKVYIYGRGYVGKSVAEYLINEHLNFEKFVVTSNEEKFQDTIEFKDIQNLPKEDGVILALGLEAFNQVFPKVKEVYRLDQMLCPRYR